MEGMKVNEIEMINDLMNSFKKDNVILYIGRNGRKELTPEICSLPWACVVTSCTDDIGVEFAKQGKDTIRYTTYKKLPNQLFVKNKFPIIQLYGKDNVMDDILEEYEDDLLRREVIKKQSENIFDYVIKRMDMRTRMVIIGYAVEDIEEFPLQSMAVSITYMRGGIADIYGIIDDKKMASLLKCIERRGGKSTSCKLKNLVEKYLNLSENYQEFDKKKGRIFYKGGMPASISNSFLLGCSRSIQLLTEELIYETRPLGKIEQQEWFPNFLNNSSDRPQWYGYLEQSQFYVKRDYEDYFFSLVSNLLSGKNMKQIENTPIILQGPPGSSKSIEMAALSVKIFEKHINPVIFVNSDKLLFAENSPEVEEIDTIMQQVENIGEKDTKFLIVWDSSSYKDIAVNTTNMMRILQNRGRRFVLVCTAYGSDFGANSLLGRKNNNWYSYKKSENVFFRSNDNSGDILFDGKFYYVYASSLISEEERTSLKNTVERYSLLPSDQNKLFWKNMKDEDKLFVIFYRLMIALQPKLTKGLSREQRLVQQFVNRQLEIIDSNKEEEERDNTMLKALMEAGINLSENEKNEMVQDDIEENFDLDRFTQIIAIFGQFKLDTPFSFAMHSLYRNIDKYNSYLDTYYSHNSRKLFALLTTEIPFIHYYENEYGKRVFRYRNTLEATLFLSRNNIEPQKQIELINDGLAYYAESYKSLGEVDDELKVSLEKVLRMIGPNTDYIDFLRGHSKQKEHEEFLKNMESLINKLEDLRLQEIPDYNSGFVTIEITFVREYFGKLWDILKKCDSKGMSGFNNPWALNPEQYNEDKYIYRIKKLKEACNLALENIEVKQKSIVTSNTYERGHLMDQINGLSVEACLCSDSLKNVWEEYELYCQDKNIDIKIDKKEYSPLQYCLQYEMLVKAIDTAPLNGYIYNALFNAFEKEYERSKSSEYKIALLSEIKLIADEASEYSIINRGMNGRDDISQHISKIMQYASEINVTIDNIRMQEPSPFFELYNKMLKQKNASAICFVCQQELNNAGLGGGTNLENNHSEDKNLLTDEQTRVCKKITEFMTQDEYYSECISKNHHALYLLLRVEWMLFNKTPLSAAKEYQLTYATKDEWKKINEICIDYRMCAGEKIRPIVILVQALSELQLTHNYKKAYEIVNEMTVTDFTTTPRMRVPFLVCFEPGKPAEYTGTVISQKNYRGYIQYDNLPKRLGAEIGIRFYMKNMGWKSMPQDGKVLECIHLGIGFTGFSAYLYKE